MALLSLSREPALARQGGQRSRGTSRGRDPAGWPDGMGPGERNPDRRGWGEGAREGLTRDCTHGLGPDPSRGDHDGRLVSLRSAYHMVLSVPFPWRGPVQLMQAATGSGGARQLFGASLSPWWEQKSAYLVPVLALCFAAGGLLLIRARIRDGSFREARRRALLDWRSPCLASCIFRQQSSFLLLRERRVPAAHGLSPGSDCACSLRPAVVWLLDWADAANRPMAPLQPSFGPIGCSGHRSDRWNGSRVWMLPTDSRPVSLRF